MKRALIVVALASALILSYLAGLVVGTWNGTAAQRERDAEFVGRCANDGGVASWQDGGVVCSKPYADVKP